MFNWFLCNNFNKLIYFYMFYNVLFRKYIKRVGQIIVGTTIFEVGYYKGTQSKELDDIENFVFFKGVYNFIMKMVEILCSIHATIYNLFDCMTCGFIFLNNFFMFLLYVFIIFLCTLVIVYIKNIIYFFKRLTWNENIINTYNIEILSQMPEVDPSTVLKSLTDGCERLAIELTLEEEDFDSKELKSLIGEVRRLIELLNKINSKTDVNFSKVELQMLIVRSKIIYIYNFVLNYYKYYNSLDDFQKTQYKTTLEECVRFLEKNIKEKSISLSNKK